MPEINSSTQTGVDIRALQERAAQPARANRKNVTIIDRRNDHLDKSSFLKLLVKQLEHQDPLQPVSDREFIAQMAQFSSLEQMQNVAKSMDSMKSFQANFLVGRNVTGRDFVTGRPIQGVVDQVLFDANQQVFLRVNGRRIKFNDLTSIRAKDQEAPPIPPATQNSSWESSHKTTIKGNLENK